MRAELALLGLVAVSLGAKLSANDYAQVADHPRLERDLVARLRSLGFTVMREERHGRPPAFLGTRGRCRVWVREAVDIASYGGSYARDAAPIGPVRYRIGTSHYAAPPTAHAWAAEFGHYSLARLGLGGGARAAPLAYAIARDCPPDALDLAGIQLAYLSAG